eukprot:gnl/MRDRNA2_/MRDRNA2_21291_c0_seq1.p1 gnl/MRDRNA2_/MRDRNA2_21291_c0~~gnl/MRDRNA2_/MRDRNA2_21291_c0_seq1.p1  ORF type:complete len:196 (+),score=33.96 gnl/MRDRNA2_/MRDRNA2_21291_c0_seq1:89-589(+)
MLAAFAGMLRQRRLTIFPSLWCTNGLGEPQHLQAARVVVPDSAAAAARHLRLWHGDFVQKGGPSSFDAVVTAFLLDAVASLPDAVAAVARRLRPGGIWVNIGPLKFNYKDSPHFSFAELAALAVVFGFDVEEETAVQECDYVPRAFSTGCREVYDVRLLVARKRSE